MNQTQNSNTAQPVQHEKLNLSATQVIASGLAAISSTVAASYFGVAGTVIGAAFGAVITVVGNAVYGYYLRRTRNRVLDLAVSQRFSTNRTREISLDASGQMAQERPPVRPARTPMRWQPKKLALAAGGLFVVLMAATTGFELASGQPLSATLTGNHGSGISLGGTESKKTTPKPAGPMSTSPSSSASTQPPSASPTVTVTVTPSTGSTSSETPTPSDGASDSGSSSSSPSSSSSESGSTTPIPTPAPSG